MSDPRRERAVAAIMDRDFSCHQTNPGIAEALVDRILEAIQPDPQPSVVTAEMVDRACSVLESDDWFQGEFPESAMKRAIEAALDPKAVPNA